MKDNRPWHKLAGIRPVELKTMLNSAYSYGSMILLKSNLENIVRKREKAI